MLTISIRPSVGEEKEILQQIKHHHRPHMFPLPKGWWFGLALIRSACLLFQGFCNYLCTVQRKADDGSAKSDSDSAIVTVTAW